MSEAKRMDRRDERSGAKRIDRRDGGGVIDCVSIDNYPLIIVFRQLIEAIILCPRRFYGVNVTPFVDSALRFLDFIRRCFTRIGGNSTEF